MRLSRRHSKFCNSMDVTLFCSWMKSTASISRSKMLFCLSWSRGWLLLLERPPRTHRLKSTMPCCHGHKSMYCMHCRPRNWELYSSMRRNWPWKICSSTTMRASALSVMQTVMRADYSMCWNSCKMPRKPQV